MSNKIIDRLARTYFVLNLYSHFLESKGYLQSKRNNRRKRRTEENYPIDFVVTWVNGNDPEWIESRKQYEKENSDIKGNNEARWRDWDCFQYWFRAVEKYAPWVRKVFLVTCGHVPDWLNCHAEKLVIVRHDEFIPKRYLPTFNSNTIELNLHRIEELSEHFVCFNDDEILNAPCRPSDFFCEGMPRYPLMAVQLYPSENMQLFTYTRYNDAGAVNSCFDIRQSIKENSEKWFTEKNNKRARGYNRNVFIEGKIHGLAIVHLCFPLRKTVFEQVWGKLYQQIDDSCSHRFREYNNYTLFLIVYWYLLQGMVDPVDMHHYGKYYDVGDIDSLIEAIKKENYKIICFNDTENTSEAQYLELKSRLKDAFEATYPNKSGYEI